MAASVFFVLAWLAATGAAHGRSSSLAAFVVGLTFAVLGPTRSAYVLDLVEPDKQPNAIALNQVALNARASPALRSAARSWPGPRSAPPARSC